MTTLPIDRRADAAENNTAPASEEPPSDSIVRYRLPGVDGLRFLLACLVVSWHLKPFAPSLIFDKTTYLKHTVTLSDLFYFNFTLLAVPAFVLISSLLVFPRMNVDYFRHRSGYLGALTAFWALVYLAYFPAERVIPTTVPALLDRLIHGYGPGYFFICLWYCDTLVLALKNLSQRASVAIASTICASFLIWPFLIPGHPQASYLAIFYSPLNFVVYPAMATIIWRWPLRWQPSEKIGGIAIVIIYIFLCSVEWASLPSDVYIDYHGYAFPAYSRPSVAIGALCLVWLFWKVPLLQKQWFIPLGGLALGIYVLHAIVFDILRYLPYVLDSAQQTLVTILISILATIFVRALLKYRLI